MSNGHSEELRTDIVTLTTHIIAEQQKSGKPATGDMSLLLSSIGSACKWISNVVRKAELLKVIGATAITNVQAETVQKLDVLSNEIFINLIKGTGRAAILVSEENDEAIFIESERGHYIVVFDPLDGSSNIDCGVSVGTIFGIYHVLDRSAKPSLKDVLRPGTEMVAGGYCMYGSSTIMVLTTGDGVDGFTLDPNTGEFLLTHQKIKLGKKKIYSINEGNSHAFDKAVKAYLDSVKFPPAVNGKVPAYTARYVGSMVGDVHRTLLYGGIFMYPTGKLRILYECFPMAMLMEQAGGKASTGRKRMLEVVPESIHSRAPIFLGTAAEVDAVEALYKKLDAGQL
ncbi:inositol phosphatase [Rhizoclosmatium globosum]|uniref:Fructose-1,6-bisphosphatase n=1 Tax=Rhizoclosmatium globosum TaxID=329046 RepID=A0A1Y2CYI7_9FUNG|nr:Fructose-1,6-bisphosphatase [Rhizoclosmatium hyalinum]KAJ3288032.1 Fructose-1,6-bisphosphatase [Rhizoclosmatium sp. JEL0117]ORY52099.1 inositol phosphatase [Rhizoclosmatium globosum]|eukprot:ORY52099.1 inositol phosphatase [Rhizoclosmatium globosum]